MHMGIIKVKLTGNFIVFLVECTPGNKNADRHIADFGREGK